MLDNNCLPEFDYGPRMDARSAVKWIVAILIITAGTSDCIIYAGPIHFYGGEFNLPIIDQPGPDSVMTEAIIEVPHNLIISDLDVRITITHTNVFDLQLLIQDPLGTRLCLNMYDFKNEFSVYPNYTDTTFDDEAQLSIKQAEPPFTGAFRPTEPYRLSQFDGRDAYGHWSLQIYDMFDWDTGTLDSFELMITTPEPTTAALLILGTALLTFFRPRRNN